MRHLFIVIDCRGKAAKQRSWKRIGRLVLETMAALEPSTDLKQWRIDTAKAYAASKGSAYNSECQDGCDAAADSSRVAFYQSDLE